MINCFIQLSRDVKRIHINGEPATIYAEIGEIIAVALLTMKKDERKKFKAALMNEVKSF